MAFHDAATPEDLPDYHNSDELSEDYAPISERGAWCPECGALFYNVVRLCECPDCGGELVR